MRTRIVLPLPTNAWEAYVELPAIPREGETFVFNGIERTVRNVIWFFDEGTANPRVQITLKPNADEGA